MTHNAKPDQKNHLNTLSHLLLRLHKSLLQFQKEKHEASEDKNLSAYDVLHLSLTHPDFEWLRKISGLVVRIDEALDDKALVIAELHRSAITEIHSMFFEDSDDFADFKSNLTLAQSKDPLLEIQVLEIKKTLGQLPLSS